MWQATQGIFTALDSVQLTLISIGYIVLGVAMLGAPAFGKGSAGVSVVLGVAGAVGALASFFVPLAQFVPAITNLTFLFLFGWKVYSLSRAA